MVSSPAIQAQGKIIRRKIALLEENNKMTITFSKAILAKHDKATSFAMCERLWKIAECLYDDRIQVEEMIQDLERQLKECY